MRVARLLGAACFAALAIALAGGVLAAPGGRAILIIASRDSQQPAYEHFMAGFRGILRADNGHMESFFHSMKSEAIHGRTFDEEGDVRATVRSYIPFYNGTRLHSSLNYVPPATFEQQLASRRCQ